MKPTELNVDMKSCWSLTTWDCEPEPGASSRVGERAQAGGDRGDNSFFFFIQRGEQQRVGEMWREASGSAAQGKWP